MKKFWIMVRSGPGVSYKAYTEANNSYHAQQIFEGQYGKQNLQGSVQPVY